MCAKSWSNSDNEFFVRNISTISAEELAERFAVSEKAVKVKARRLGVYDQLFYRKKLTRKSWSKADEQYLQENYGRVAINQLAEFFGVSYAAVVTKANKRLGMNSKLISEKFWSEDEDVLLKEHFQYAPQKKIMKMFPNRTWTGILQRGIKTLQLNRLSQDRHSIDYHFLDEWTEQSAYLAGYVAADGHIFYHRGEQNKSALQFEIAAYDRDILDKIKEVLHFEGPILETSRNTVKMNISNTRIIEMLIEKGIPALNKSSDMKWPSTLPKCYQNAFVRGIFDGDGSVYLENSTGRIRTQFLGTENLLMGIKQAMPFDTSTVSICYRGNTEKGANIYCLSFSTKHSIALLNWLYKDSTIHLDRKYNKFLNFIKEKGHSD